MWLSCPVIWSIKLKRYPANIPLLLNHAPLSQRWIDRFCVGLKNFGKICVNCKTCRVKHQKVCYRFPVGVRFTQPGTILSEHLCRNKSSRFIHVNGWVSVFSCSFLPSFLILVIRGFWTSERQQNKSQRPFDWQTAVSIVQRTTLDYESSGGGGE